MATAKRAVGIPREGRAFPGVARRLGRDRGWGGKATARIVEHGAGPSHARRGLLGGFLIERVAEHVDEPAAVFAEDLAEREFELVARDRDAPDGTSLTVGVSLGHGSEAEGLKRRTQRLAKQSREACPGRARHSQTAHTPTQASIRVGSPPVAGTASAPSAPSVNWA